MFKINTNLARLLCWNFTYISVKSCSFQVEATGPTFLYCMDKDATNYRGWSRKTSNYREVLPQWKNSNYLIKGPKSIRIIQFSTGIFEWDPPFTLNYWGFREVSNYQSSNYLIKFNYRYIVGKFLLCKIFFFFFSFHFRWWSTYNFSNLFCG